MPELLEFEEPIGVLHKEIEALSMPPSRSGVDGHIMLEPKDLHVHAKLGFLTAMFKEPIESEIKRVLTETF